MSCKQRVYTTLKPSTTPGVAPTILSHWIIGPDGAAVVVDPADYTNCLEVTTSYEKECFIIVGEDPQICREGKCIIRTTFDCSQPVGSQYTTTVEGIIHPETGATLPIGTADGEATIVPCVEVTTVSTDYCPVGK